MHVVLHGHDDVTATGEQHRCDDDGGGGCNGRHCPSRAERGEMRENAYERRCQVPVRRPERLDVAAAKAGRPWLIHARGLLSFH